MASGLGKILLIILSFYESSALLEQGIFHLKFTEKQNVVAITKSMYNSTEISVHVDCDSDPVVTLTFDWYMWWSPCASQFQNLGIGINNFARKPTDNNLNNTNQEDMYFQSSAKFVHKKCSGVIDLFPDERDLGPTKQGTAKPVQVSTTTAKSTTTTTKARQKRVATEPNLISTSTTTRRSFTLQELHNIDYQVVTTTKNDGTHMFILVISPEYDQDKFIADVSIYMKGPHGYLSAVEWPLLPFYGTMCLVYLIYGIVWLILLGCNWRDLLRVQFWIGGVILIGMLEKAVFFAEYESVNSTGKSVRGALIFAEIVSSLKRSTARVLVLIVSLGFGIVRSHLGSMLYKVVGVGTVYFILATIESCVRVTSDNNNKAALKSSIALAVLDVALWLWIFISLVQTTRTLRLRRNLHNLSLYRHFTNTLIFAVLASIAYAIWSVKQHKFAVCLRDWHDIWVDDAFYHILFCIILMVIMVLWRPTLNNQRYAFSPLLDAAEEDESDDEKPMNEALGISQSNDISTDVCDFYKQNIQGTFPDSNVVFDVYRKEKTLPEVHLVTREGVQPNPLQQFGVPLDTVHLTIGADTNKLKSQNSEESVSSDE